MISHDITWYRIESHGVTWDHLGSHGIIVAIWHIRDLFILYIESCGIFRPQIGSKDARFSSLIKANNTIVMLARQSVTQQQQHQEQQCAKTTLIRDLQESFSINKTRLF